MKLKTAALLLAFSLNANAGLSQSSLDQFADKATLFFEVKDNFASGSGKHTAQIDIRNHSKVALPAGESDWSIYFHYIRMVDKTVTQGVTIEHVQGDLHRISPTKAFKGLNANQSLQLTFKGSVWVVSDSDFMPGAFIAGGDSKSAIFANTNTGQAKDYIKPFLAPNQQLRYSTPKDLYPIATAQRRFDNNQSKANSNNTLNYALSAEQAQKTIIPTPTQVKQRRGEATIDGQWAVSFAGRLTSESKYFVAAFKANSGIELAAKADHISQGDKRLIQLKVDASIENGKAESYTLDIGKKNIVVAGADNAGVFYGLQSLLSLVAVQKADSVSLPVMNVQDSPRYDWRGMHYDMARNFHSKAVTLQLIEQMARYKLNKLHLHLTDDEGWRVEIPGLPELTDIGGKRCFDLTEKRCLLTQLGTGPDVSGTGNGFYSTKDFVEILKYAAVRHIEIIPEVDMPGHSRAAIKAMEARYDTLMAAGKTTQASAYLLSEKADTSKYYTVQNYTDSAANVCLDSTYHFVDKVVYEFEQMYRQAGLKMNKFHVGGDEVGRGAWTGSPACQALFEKFDNGVTGVNDLKPYFTSKVAKILNKRGIDMAAWEDGMMSDALTPFNRELYGDNDVIVHAWDNIWEFGVADRAYRLANEDYKVVLASATHLYFDHPQESHSQERGYYWAARFTDTEKVFGFKPDNLYGNADFMRNGTPIVNIEADVGRELMALKKPENILGMQGHVWSETIRTPSQLNQMLYPRMIALAQRAWHKASWENGNDKSDESDKAQQAKDWAKFSSVLGHKEFSRLAADKVEYYLPVPGGQISNGQLEANVSMPGLTIQYSQDNGASWSDYSGKVSVSGSVLLRTHGVDGHNSRATTVK
ncbi:MAG: hexosaminidase [Phenylobacterium sp.]|jgi:hexosaminidase